MPVVVSFVSQKGGVGKSSLARALAAVGGHAGIKLLLADLDPQQKTVTRWQRLREKNPSAPQIDVRPFSSLADAVESGYGYDLLIIDTPGSVTRSTLEIAKKSHLVIQPTGPSLDDLDPAILLFHELSAAGIPKNRMAAALCRTASASEETEARRYIEQAGFEVLAASIPERMAYRAAQNHGLGLTETKEKAMNARADALIAELMLKVAGEIRSMKKVVKPRGKENIA